MKKIMFIFILSFLFIFDVRANSKFYLGERVPDMHIESIKGSDIHNGVPFILRRDDGEFVYCINPFEKLNTTSYYSEYSYNDYYFNLSSEQINRMNLIAYYGYGYKNHTELKWYGVSQLLIWKELGLDDIYFTESARGGKIVAYENELKEIESLVNDYYILPSFARNNYEYSVFDNIKIEDLNGVLSNYSIKESNIESKIDGNTLYVSTKEVGSYEITFIRKSPVDRNYLLYGLSGNQSLIYPGKINDIEFKITIDVISGSITVNKIDSEQTKREFATLEGAIYGIYSDNELISEIKTNEIGIASIDNLHLGKYEVKELVPSLGYEIDQNIYEIELTYNNNDVVINSYENVIRGNIELNKYYGEYDNYYKEDGATFDIYDINDKLVGTYITENGIVNEILDYGNYYVIQTNGIQGYNFVDKFNISINESKKYSYDLYDEILIVEVPNTMKNDSYRLIPIVFILLGILLIIKSLIGNIKSTMII